MEQEEYVKEGIDWKEIKFVDNQPLLVRMSSHDNVYIVVLPLVCFWNLNF